MYVYYSYDTPYTPSHQILQYGIYGTVLLYITVCEKIPDVKCLQKLKNSATVACPGCLSRVASERQTNNGASYRHPNGP